jgi:hypothetical protein
MTRTRPDALLRTALTLDAVASGGLGLLAALGAGWLDALTGLRAGALVAVGVFLLGYAAAVGVIGTRPRVSVPAVWVVIVGNAAWTAASAVVALGESLTGLGVALVVAQAAAVALFVVLQYLGVRRLSGR